MRYFVAYLHTFWYYEHTKLATKETDMIDIQPHVLHESKSISNQVCDTIRRLIINKSIPSGERLVETKIAKDLDVSITPVRQAFAQLSNEGLLTVFPFKGTYVTQITEAFVKDVLQTRLILEPGAVNLCFDALTHEDSKQLKLYTHRSDAYCSSGMIFEATEEDLHFHDYFFRRCDNELLQRMWSILRTRIQYIQSYTKPQILPFDYLTKRHAGMIESIDRKDKQSFITSLIDHIETSFDFNYFSGSADII